MAIKLSAVYIALALALPLTALADAPTPTNPNAVKSTKPPVHTAKQPKTKCCSGRAQPQPKPPQPQK
jgi:hypothetical protein